MVSGRVEFHESRGPSFLLGRSSIPEILFQEISEAYEVLSKSGSADMKEDLISFSPPRAGGAMGGATADWEMSECKAFSPEHFNEGFHSDALYLLPDGKRICAKWNRGCCQKMMTTPTLPRTRQLF